MTNLTFQAHVRASIKTVKRKIQIFHCKGARKYDEF